MNELEVGFVLDPQLEKDCIYLGDLPLCRVFLMNDHQFPWFILVPRRAEVSELYHLSLTDRNQMMVESCDLSAALADGYQADKMNVANLGNMVKQLHVHHIVRYEEDVAWPGPIWGKCAPIPYNKDEIENIQKKISSLLEGELQYQPKSEEGSD